MSRWPSQDLPFETRSIVSLEQEDGDSQLRQNMTQYRRCEPSTQTTEDLTIQDDSVTGPSPQILNLLHDPIPRPLSLHKTRIQGRRCGKGHVHRAWPQRGDVIVKKCERFCFFCRLEVQTAATLRKHINDRHKKKDGMSIDVAISNSGRCRDALPVLVSRNDRPPSHDPSTSTSHEMDDVEERDEGTREAASPIRESNFIFHPSSERSPPPNIEEIMDPENRPATPLPKPILRQAKCRRIDSADLQALRVELKELHVQNVLISKILRCLRDQNTQMYSRATAFQALHDRHENSTNSIWIFTKTHCSKERWMDEQKETDGF
ncbi:hypothetical protein G6011_07539 [Alternaria panax]|uniref:Uncharacterized protein n=1 Tax=Alternaria panax TaxID=48097 RepID=A0AAD4I9I1_9PLEO|nr:hypothetical protein G6011_07539 [Alternaria panax]